MKARLHLVLASFALVLLAGCAGTHQMTSTAPEPQRELTREQQYITYVERNAKRRGIHLTWVNPPQFAEDDKKQ